MPAKFLVASTSQSGWINILLKGDTRHIGSWMFRVTKQANGKSEIYITISIWPRDKKFDKAFISCLGRFGKSLDGEDFKVKPARMLDQEYEITYTVDTSLQDTAIANMMTRLGKMRIFSSLGAVLEKEKNILYQTGC
ncbi:MAG: hypothetical protein Q8R40_06685 [bacterium]|nr:hypothetical protein [bacterium]